MQSPLFQFLRIKQSVVGKKVVQICYLAMKRSSSRSGGSVVILGKRSRVVQSQQQVYVQKVMTPRQKCIYFLLLAIWLSALLFFWDWWLRADHIVTLTGMIINSLILFWSTVLPAYYFFFVARLCRPATTLTPPEGRVAMVVTKAPVEPWSLVQKTLEAMKQQQYPFPYDVWIADEDPTPESLQWCTEQGIYVSCRKGITDYHNKAWPRRQKCKEGNLAYFYDTYGYDRYDFVVQMDADHVPEPEYLSRMIVPFHDVSVGYVAAPSICDANSKYSWSARARLYSEAGTHGPLQAGYSAGFAPLCIGSHYAVRTSALCEIGGLGPELAEDHSTTLLFNAGGWKGSFAFNAFAHGDGPECLTDAILQEFQWSQSVTKILLTLTPKCWRNLSLRLRMQFLISQFYYMFTAIFMLISTILPICAIIIQKPFVDVPYLDFLFHIIVPEAICLMVVGWIRLQKWFRPVNARIISWEAVLFQCVRWPWILFGVFSAVICTPLKKEMAFRVTPKKTGVLRSLPGRILFPYACIVFLFCCCAILFEGGAAHNYQYLVSCTILLYTAVLWLCIIYHIRDNRGYGRKLIWQSIKNPLCLAVLSSCCVIVDVLVRFHDIISPFLT